MVALTVIFLLSVLWSGLEASLPSFISEGPVLELKGQALKGKNPLLVRGFVGFPRGNSIEPRTLMVVDGRGRPCPADLMPTAFWEDGSVRYLVIKTVVVPRLSGGRIRLCSKGRETPSSRGIHYSRGMGSPREHLIDTGRISLILSPKSDGPIQGIHMKGGGCLSAIKAMDLIVSVGDGLYRAGPPGAIRIVEGEAETEVILTGVTRSSIAGLGPSYTLRLFLHAAGARFWCNVEVAASSFEGRSDGIDLLIEPTPRVRRPRTRLLGDIPGTVVALRSKEPVCLISRGGGVFYRIGDEEAVGFPLIRSAGLMMERSGRGLLLAIPHFKTLHPWEVSLEPSGRLKLALFGGSFQWEQGMTFEREFVLYPRISPVHTSLPEDVHGAARAALFGLTADPAGRSFPFTPLRKSLFSDPLFETYQEATGRLIHLLRREWAIWDGYRDYGDYRTGFGHFANCEYDPAYGLLKRFLLTRRMEDLVNAEIMLKHWLKFDRTGPYESGIPEGLPYVHGVDHCTGRIEPGHMWVDGALLFALLTGERTFKEAARCIGRYLAEVGRTHPKDEHERSAAWSLMALTALKDAGIGAFGTAANRVAARIRDRQSEVGYFRFRTVEQEDATLYAVNTWVTSGITMEALYRHYCLTGDSRSLEALLRAAAWLDRAGRDPETGGWFQNLFYDKSDESALVERRGSVWSDEAPFIALGLARAGFLSTDRRLAGLARRTLEKAMKALSSRPPAHPGKAVAVLLRCAPEILLMTCEAERWK